MNAPPPTEIAATPPSLPMRTAAQVGTTALELFVSGRDLFSVFVRTLYYVARGKRERHVVVHQAFEMGNRSVLFLVVTMGFIGTILVYQGGLQLRRVVPDFTQLGANFLQLLVRDLAASIGALMLATRIGAGIAAELGSMVVTEQIDALRMCAADPIDFLVVPRFLAGLVMTGMLIVLGGAVAFGAGAITAHVAFEVPYQTFLTARSVRFGDILTGVAKCVAYGAAIPIVSSHCGLSTFGGSEGVGWATTRAVVNSSLAILILNFFISGAALLIFPP
jgi:phospholipid/cholesterol/gamma-HCH transport system permease protein